MSHVQIKLKVATETKLVHTVSHGLIKLELATIQKLYHTFAHRQKKLDFYKRTMTFLAHKVKGNIEN